jgi:hypothetical protein
MSLITDHGCGDAHRSKDRVSNNYDRSRYGHYSFLTLEMGLLQSMLGQPLEDVSIRLRGRVVQVDGMSRVPAVTMRIGNHQLQTHRNRTSLKDSRRKVRLEASSVGVQCLDLGGQVGTVTDTPPGTVDEIVRAGDYEDVTGKVGSGLRRCDGSSERDYAHGRSL